MKPDSCNLIPVFFLLCFTFFSCERDKKDFDATGAFEAVETVISAQASGTLEKFDLEEGMQLKSGDVIGYIDTTQLYLRKKQLMSQVKSTLSQRPEIGLQVAALQTKLKSLERDRERFSNLVAEEAAPKKQLDDINAEIETVKDQINAQKSSLGITSSSIEKQSVPFEMQIEQLNDQIEKSKIINPVDGTVLDKFAEQHELMSPGKPLYKIADLTQLKLRAYLTANLLSQAKLNQKVKVFIDNPDGSMKSYDGTIEWISTESEFTPKTIQTKDERQNLVYAVKIKVVNDGMLRIGMYGEVKL
jgi:HlyD family secretion protein